MTDPGRDIDVVGLVGGIPFGGGATALAGADVLVGSPRQLALVTPTARATVVELRTPLIDVLARIEQARGEGEAVCVLASGDPGFFGIVRALGDHFGPSALRIHPAPSSVALAFARLGLPWDDALVVSAHGRELDSALDAVAAVGGRTVAVLTAPDAAPELVCRRLVERVGDRPATVLARLGEAEEQICSGTLAQLGDRHFDPLAVLVVGAPTVPARPTTTWGRTETEFAHRDGMITKAEVRAIALGKLALPPTGVLWDLGAGSGSVAIEAAALAPGLRVYAIERAAAAVEDIRTNASAHGVHVDVVHGLAPPALDSLPDPDRVFVGGGGLAVLDAALDRLRPGGTVVANYALMDRAVAAWARLGNLVQVSVSRASTVADGFRLAAEHPVFVTWGPT